MHNFCNVTAKSPFVTPEEPWPPERWLQMRPSHGAVLELLPPLASRSSNHDRTFPRMPDTFPGRSSRLGTGVRQQEFAGIRLHTTATVTAFVFPNASARDPQHDDACPVAVWYDGGRAWGRSRGSVCSSLPVWSLGLHAWFLWDRPSGLVFWLPAIQCPARCSASVYHDDDGHFAERACNSATRDCPRCSRYPIDRVLEYQTQKARADSARGSQGGGLMLLVVVTVRDRLPHRALAYRRGRE